MKLKKKKSDLRLLIEQTLKKKITKLGCENVLNAGDTTQKYKQYFADVEYLTLDKQGGDIQADLHDLSSIHREFDLILCISVLEHVENPFLVVENLKRLLKPNGYLFVSVPFFYHYHHGKGYDDYWRFTEKGLEYIVGMDKEFIVTTSSNQGFCGLFRKGK